MSLTKVNYIDNSTIITAQNLNDIQDNIIQNIQNLNDIQDNIIQNTQLIKKAAPRNLLDNSDFTNPVNQREFVSGGIGEAKYSIDRWLLQYDTYLHLESDSIALSGWWTFWQYVPVKLYAGKTYTMAAMIKGENGTEDAFIGLHDRINQVDITAERKSDIGTDWSLIIKTFTISADYEIGNTNFNIGINTGIEQTSKTYFKWAALYEGEYTEETLPEYQPKGYSIEFTECQRYYQKLYLGSSQLSTATANASYVKYYLHPVMRIDKPTISYDFDYNYESWVSLEQIKEIMPGAITLQYKPSKTTYDFYGLATLSADL